MADLTALNPYTNEMGCFELADYKVDKWSTICMKTSHYSVPDTLVGKIVNVKIYSEKLVILYGGSKVAVHERIYTNGGWSVKLEHYLTTLIRKPGALNGSLALKQMPEKVRTLFEKHFTGKAKDFVFLLQYAKDNNFTDNDMIEACQALNRRGIRNISADQIKAMMHTNNEVEETLPILSLPDILLGEASKIEDESMKTLLDLSQMMEMEENVNNYQLID
jgi:hypothetical protein